MSWDVFVIGLGTFSDGFGMVLQKNVGRGRKMNIFKNGQEYFSEAVGTARVRGRTRMVHGGYVECWII